MSDALVTRVDAELFAEPGGYWHYISMIRCPDLALPDASDAAVARLMQRASALKVWWNNGPQHYVAVYTHSVTALSASTELFLRLKWMNQGGGTEKVETIAARIHCHDADRRACWSFSITSEQSELIKRFTAEPFGPVIWTRCDSTDEGRR